MISFIKQDIKSTITPPSIVYLFNNIIIKNQIHSVYERARISPFLSYHKNFISHW